jgi:Fe-S oxidoreductase
LNSLIDQTWVENIRRTGCFYDPAPDRIAIFEKYGLPYDRPAENAVITGCQVIASLPHVLVSLARLFDRRGFSYTFLSREYCCGNTLYRPAIKARDDAAMAACRTLSREFTGKTIASARQLGAGRLVIFCSPCYPIYRHAWPDEDIIFYPAAIEAVMGEMTFDGKIDYYAGCYKLHRKFSPQPMDLKSTNNVFGRIGGLEINRIKAPECCYTPAGLSHMIEHVQTDCMVHICTGCYGQARKHIPEARGVNVIMLPEFVEMVEQGV